jgi:DNA-binding NarL/FixJ family response regulator
MGWNFYNSSGEVLTNFGPVALTDLDIDGGTDIGAAIVDADLFIVDDGAGGTNRKTAASRIKTYANPKTSLLTGTTAVNANTVTGITIKSAAESHSFYVYSAYSTGADIYQGAYIGADESVAAISHVRIGRADADAGGNDSFYLVNGSGGSVTYVYEVVEI